MNKSFFYLFIFLFVPFGTLHSQINTVKTFDKAYHTGGNTITQTFNLPTDVSNVSKIEMRINLDCPGGGCDGWDRYANIKVENNGEYFEIARYITPYGNSNCGWTLDLTEYAHLLTGTVSMQSFVDTWEKGWLVTTELDYHTAPPAFSEIAIKNLWVDNDFRYGDTIYYSLDLDARELYTPINTQKTIFRMALTGHGQGNTDNAAEFSDKTHSLFINGEKVADHHLWKSDCEWNPCSPQGGNWQYDRAGWCPGQGVTPFDVDITQYVIEGETMTIDYVFEPYFNHCSSLNPNCISTTCADCLYNSNGHTKPHYKISGQVIFLGNQPLAHVDEIEIIPYKIGPNPFSDELQIQVPGQFALSDFSVRDINGKLLVSKQINVVLDKHALDLSAYKTGIYFVEMKINGTSYFEKLIKQ